MLPPVVEFDQVVAESDDADVRIQGLVDSQQAAQKTCHVKPGIFAVPTLSDPQIVSTEGENDTMLFRFPDFFESPRFVPEKRRGRMQAGAFGKFCLQQAIGVELHSVPLMRPLGFFLLPDDAARDIAVDQAIQVLHRGVF